MKKKVLVVIGLTSCISSASYVAIIDEISSFKIEESKVIGTEYGEWSSAMQAGEPYNCLSFEINDEGDRYPSYDFRSKVGSIFTFDWECMLPYERTRDIFDIMSNGEKIFKEQEKEVTAIRENITVIKNALNEEIFSRRGAYFKYGEELGNNGYFNFQIRIDGKNIYRNGGYDHDKMMKEVNSLGYYLGRPLDGSSSYSFTMKNVPPQSVWIYKDKESVQNCNNPDWSAPIDIGGKLCDNVGSQVFSCHETGIFNNPEYSKGRFVCEFPI